MLRVIAGTAKGLKLATPSGTVRPTLDRVREALFSILHPRLEEARFADFFAGSGANGIEALSRGAAYCAFIDSDPRAIDTIGKNLFHTKLEHKSKRYQLTIPTALGALAKSEAPFDIVLCDPPYSSTDYATLLFQIAENKLLTEGGLLVVEHDRSLELPLSVGVLEKRREAQYGRVKIAFFS